MKNSLLILAFEHGLFHGAYAWNGDGGQLVSESLTMWSFNVHDIEKPLGQLFFVPSYYELEATMTHYRRLRPQQYYKKSPTQLAG